MWYDEDGQDKVVYSGKFEKLKRSKTYVMSLLKKGCYCNTLRGVRTPV